VEKFVNFVEAPQLVIDRIERLRNSTSCILHCHSSVCSDYNSK